MPYDARIVSNFIVYHHQQIAEPITQLRLYKLLYFSHGWHLVERQKPLVWNYFEAWQHGPVIKVVRDNFSSFGAEPIDRFSSAFDLDLGRIIELPHRLQVEDELFVEGIIRAYREFTAAELSQMTHAVGSPWERVWQSDSPVGRFGLRLKNDEILKDFQHVVDKPRLDS